MKYKVELTNSKKMPPAEIIQEIKFRSRIREFKHTEIYVSQCLKFLKTRNPDIFLWLIENIGLDNFEFEPTRNYKFKNEEDAMAFKLAWIE